MTRPTTPPAIRRAQPADRPAIRSLLRAVHLPEAGLDDVWRAWVAVSPPAGLPGGSRAGSGGAGSGGAGSGGAGSGGAVVGTVALERYPADGRPGGAVYLLRSLVVAPGARGGGLGARLVHLALAEADVRAWTGPAIAARSGNLRRDGPATVALLTETADGYVDRFGFRLVTRAELPTELAASAEFTGACPASARAYLRD